MQDISYYCCIELQGEEDTLLTALSQLTSKETGEGCYYFLFTTLKKKTQAAFFDFLRLI